MKDSQLLDFLTSNKWALDKTVLQALTGIIVRHACGIRLEPEAIDAIVATRAARTDADDDGFRVIGQVAAIPIHGVIAKHSASVNGVSQQRGTGTDAIRRNIARALNDPDVIGIALDIDSPGGQVAGTQEAADFIAEANKRKPVVAFASDTMASAALWLGAQAEEIIANATAVVGSIGVYTVMVDLSKMLADNGVTVHAVSSGEFKAAGEPGTEVTPGQLADVQRVIDGIADIFVDSVARGRGMSRSAVEEIADGRVFVGKEAVRVGLVDRIGSFSLAMKRVKAIASQRARSVRGARNEGGGSPQRSELSNMDGTPKTAAQSPEEELAAVQAQGGNVDALGVLQATGVVAAQPVTHSVVVTKGPDPEAMKAAATVAVADALIAETARQSEIKAVAKRLGLDEEWTQGQIAGEASIGDVARNGINALADVAKPVPVAIGQDFDRDTIRPAMADAIVLQGGGRVANPHARSADFRHESLFDMARAHLRAFGQPTTGKSRAEIARMAYRGGYVAGGVVHSHSTGDFPLILEDAINKSLRNGYDDQIYTWGEWMRRTTAPDFKEIKSNMMHSAPSLLIVNEGEEYTEGTIGESQEVYTLGKYGRIFAITWEALINDDLNAFVRVPAMMGAAARRLENRLAYTPLLSAAGGQDMADSTALFHADHDNLDASAAVISVAELGVGRAALRNQEDTGGTRINAVAQFLIVPPEQETLAEQIIGSVVDPATANNTMNPFANRLKVIADPVLNDSTIGAGASTTSWYLATPFNQIDTIEVAFLRGEEEPFLEQLEGFASDGRKYKVRHVVAAKAIDWRGMWKNPGA